MVVIIRAPIARVQAGSIMQPMGAATDAVWNGRYGMKRAVYMSPGRVASGVGGGAARNQASCVRMRSARSLGAGWVDRKLLELSPDKDASFSSALTQACGLYLRAFMNLSA